MAALGAFCARNGLLLHAFLADPLRYLWGMLEFTEEETGELDAMADLERGALAARGVTRSRGGEAWVGQAALFAPLGGGGRVAAEEAPAPARPTKRPT